MAQHQMTDMRVEGPDVKEATQEYVYTVHSPERDIRFSVMPEEAAGQSGWQVRIDGIPAPSIVHDEPWTSVEAARDAAIRVIDSVLDLERMQREDQERGKPKS